LSRIIPLEFIPPDIKSIVQTQSTNSEWNVSDFIIFIGRFDKIKNLNILIESIDLIKIHLPKIRLVVAGNGSSSEKKSLIKLVESLSLQEYIEFKGWLEESEWLCLLSKARMIVVPSKAESFSLVASAAICLGIPCLTSNKVGVSDFIRQYRAGEVLNSITAESISQLVLKILDTEPGNYYNNASQEFINIYSGENVIRSWREIFQI
jgi:glycosyltransferase involved in cell wall biosynthesis